MKTESEKVEQLPERIWIDRSEARKAKSRGVGSYYFEPYIPNARESEVYVRASSTPAQPVEAALILLQKLVDRVRLELRDSNSDHLGHPAWKGLIDEANILLAGRLDFPIAPSPAQDAQPEIEAAFAELRKLLPTQLGTYEITMIAGAEGSYGVRISASREEDWSPVCVGDTLEEAMAKVRMWKGQRR